ncbi:glycosyltransferase [Laspinema sp. A4]|uniref:glycosyltransferase n=1 Tax=Laspinema sp. D2d TaxID=2953686 RepID=UPI0021BB0E76|nr:glycosyltransferase [Laspinema sp. D2d]MCT7985717.1 glycosyltransferase [Laspinema sp. D2d]
MKDFGVIVACYDKDYSFAKGCCASIRYFLGDVPIALIVDGNFSIKELENAYGVHALYRPESAHECLRDKEWRSSTKMLAFWESPWEYFLYLDADIVVWGDLLKFANFTDYDMIIDHPAYEFTNEAINKWFFNGIQIEKYFPDFQWQQRPYFCTGVFFAKRNIFDLTEYQKLLELRLANPKMFYGMDQGLLNLMIFRAADRGEIRLKQESMQVIISNFSISELNQRFPMDKTGPICIENDATVIHWSGQKPFISRSTVYSEPMNFFRRKFIQDAWGYQGLRAELMLQIEDFKMYKNKLMRRLIPWSK